MTTRRSRFFAVALRIDPARTASYESFRSALSAVLHTHVEPARQTGLPTFVAMPEHTGLLAAFIGTRGDAARERLQAGAPALDALTTLAFGYGEQLGHYAGTYPNVTSPGQLLHLALTDTLVRGVVDVGSALAAEHGLWLSMGAALARWQRVDGEAAKVLGDPDVEAGSAYAACDEQVRNRNLIFDPTGRLAVVHDKAYLVPIERDAAGGLGLCAAGVEEVAALELPFARLGTVISKDAWMPDVNERLDQLGAQVLIQPEAYDRWAVPDRQEAGEDLWPPDKLQRGGWWMVQQHPSFRMNVTPMLTGSLGDLFFDGQPLVAVPTPGGDPRLGLLGQPADEGWAAVGVWDDCDEPAGALADPARRREFAEHGARLLPGSGDSQGGAVAEGAVWADAVLPAVLPVRPAVEPLAGVSRSQALPGPPGTQLLPELGTDGERAWLAAVGFDDRGRQRVVVHAGDGHTWDDGSPLPHPAVLDGSQHDRQWHPRLHIGPAGPSLVFLAFAAGSWDVFATSMTPEGWAAPVRVDDAHDTAGVLRERGHSRPHLVTADGALTAVWSDLRWPWVFAQVRSARSEDAGRSWSPSERVDGRSLAGEPDPLNPRSPHETRGQAAPAAAFDAAGLLVAWQERTAGGAQAVWVTRPAAGSPPIQLSAGRAAAHRPAMVCAGARCWVVWEAHAPEGGSRLVARSTRDGGLGWTDPVVIDPVCPAGTTQRHVALVALAGEQVAVLFGDDRTGDERVLATAVDPHHGSTPPRQISDAPPGEVARAPAAAVVGERLVVAWQDTRAGVERVRTASAPIASLRRIPCP